MQKAGVTPASWNAPTVSGFAASRRTSRPSPSQDLTCSVLGGDRPAPAEAIVHADLDGVIVVAKARADDLGRAAGEGGVAEIIVLVFGLRRPVRGEHVFKAGTDGPAILMVGVGGEGDRGTCDGDADVRVVAPGVAALGVEQ